MEFRRDECMYILSKVEIIDAGQISTETLVVPVDLSGCNEL